MKNLTKAFAVIALTTASFATFAATEVNMAPAGSQSAGVVSASVNGGDLSSLQGKLAAKASQEGASSYRIISAGGENHLYGTAEIYK
ncbi:YdgH/BhsA/McbA-like domain containing protein [Rouxiella sp. WC2420]|uniref:YdgH/BhsA/McbA-like domain containing protein n=1 Tax=Rouxiella sp. WC2420 TaxID=3234145 RepID=A0AB39VLJ1_9GAMM